MKVTSSDVILFIYTFWLKYVIYIQISVRKICYYVCINIFPPECPEKEEEESLIMPIAGYTHHLNMSWYPYHVI